MSNNPLKSYFRRPALYFKLPSEGKGYGPGSIDLPENGEIPIYPMTALDEITTRTPDALFNGMAVTEIIKSCAPNIKDPWQMPQTDLDPLLIAIKIASTGQKMEIDTLCPKCEETSKFDVDLTGLLSQFKAGNYNETLGIDQLQIKFKPLNYTKVNEASMQQFEVTRAMNMLDNMRTDTEREKITTELIAKMQRMALDLIVDSVEYIKTPDAIVIEPEFIKEFLENCDKKSYDLIRDTSIELKKSTEVKPLKFKCVHCEHEYDQIFNINVSDFFG